ncbi:DUF3575 domain-containing protein [Emticicia sp. BO119]|uniref:DUF3575 domain-containing protein n=1 Tax=Emticicia sp. BO119 TaxID=2757768 RepID=UPI0015F0FF45|nr:DUF3575 domain-containing protein [Emticicia sp. BO119]MBA4849148.1 DUF3575 domain-containing protein [Emticicia sp. BO119]
MRKLYIIPILLFILLQNNLGFAQEKGFILKTNLPNYFLAGGANIAFERAITATQSYVIDIGYGDYRYLDFDNVKDKYYQITLQLRRYYTNESLKGFFVSPYLRYRIKDIDQNRIEFLFVQIQEGKDFVAHSLNGGCSIGYQNFIFKKISLELNLGAGLGVYIFSKGYNYPSLIRADGLAAISAGYKF